MFDLFKKRRREPEDIFPELGQLLADQTPEDFNPVWARCLVMDDTPEVALFYQPAASPGTVDSIPLEPGTAEGIATLFLELRQAFQRRHPEPWSAATLVIDGDGHLHSDFGYEVLSASSVERFKEQWEEKYLPGLTFRGAPVLQVQKDKLPAQFQELLERAFLELQHKTAGHDAAWHLSQCRYSVNLDEGVIRFHRPDGVTATCPVQVIGTHLAQSGSWLWAWGNPSLPNSVKSHASKVREYGVQHGLPTLTTAKLICDDEMAWRLAALAVKLNDAQGGYRAQSGPAAVFLTFGNPVLSGTPG